MNTTEELLARISSLEQNVQFLVQQNMLGFDGSSYGGSAGESDMVMSVIGGGGQSPVNFVGTDQEDVQMGEGDDPNNITFESEDDSNVTVKVEGDDDTKEGDVYKDVTIKIGVYYS